MRRFARYLLKVAVGLAILVAAGAILAILTSGPDRPAVDNNDVSSIPSILSPGVIRGDYVGCLTEEALDEVMTAVANTDNRQFEALLGTSCFLLNDREYSVIDFNWGTPKIRVYVDGDSIVLWTVRKAIEK